MAVPRHHWSHSVTQNKNGNKSGDISNVAHINIDVHKPPFKTSLFSLSLMLPPSLFLLIFPFLPLAPLSLPRVNSIS